jgi:mevalonate kinase
MKALAPGKIIISGEHAVVYGKPALVMAVDRFAEATIVAQSSDKISFDLIDFDQSNSFTIRALRELKRRLVTNYHMFLDGELGIREVLVKPFELFEFVCITLIEGLHLKLEGGLRIRLQSDIPIGCGMGSSAATILSVLRVIAGHFSLDFKPKQYYDYSLEAERLQHGNPSGVDPYISLHGGYVRFQNGQAKNLPMPSTPMYLVHTGLPKSFTGECVAQVAHYFKNDKIWDDFEAITLEIEKALLKNDSSEIRRYVRENNLLLSRICVVPARVQNFITEIEKWGGAAKISGAGSISGNNGGMVVIFSDGAPLDICKKYGYSIMPIKGEPRGTRLV